MKSPLRRCGHCKEPPVVGTRCFRHYIRDRVRGLGLFKHKWMAPYFERFVQAMEGRYRLVRAGEQPPPPIILLEWVWPATDTYSRPKWRSHRKGPSETRDMLLHLIEIVDQRAKEDGDADAARALACENRPRGRTDDDRQDD